MMEYKKQIYLPHELKKHIAEIFEVSHVSVWRALNYSRNTDQAQAIRIKAMELGGRLYDGSRNEIDLARAIEPINIDRNETKESDEA